MNMKDSKTHFPADEDSHSHAKTLFRKWSTILGMRSQQGSPTLL
jgi:hypothetical protein